MSPVTLTSSALAVAALLLTSATGADALNAAAHPPPHDAGPPGAPPTPPHNGSVIIRHRRELAAMDGWSDGRCTWCVSGCREILTTAPLTRTALAPAAGTAAPAARGRTA
jgi:hypothetical protein